MVFLFLIVGMILSTPYLINTRVVKKQISEQISDWMGLPVRVSGEPVVTVFPYLTVKLRDVVIGSSLGAGEPPLVSTKTLRAEMYWLPLLLGHFEVRRFHLIEPTFELTREAKGALSWDLREGSLFQTDDDSGRLTLSNLKLGNFRISGGKAHYLDKVSGQEESLSDINLAFNWPSTEHLASINGTVSWRGETVEFSAKSGKPMELFAGGLSPLSMKLSSPLLKMSLEGSAATISNFQFEGDVSMETPALGDLAEWLGRSLPSSQPLGTASLSARANLIGASVAFSDLDLVLGKDRLNGVLQLDWRQDRPMVQGTLATDDLDLGPFMTLPASLEEAKQFDLSKSKAAQVDFDIRLSASELQLGAVKLGQTAASLVTRNNQISFSIGEAYAFGGRLEATFEMRQDGTDPTRMSSSLRAKANGVSASGAFKEMLDEELISGTALVEIDLQGDGSRLGDVLADAHGSLSMVLTDGELPQFDLGVFEDALESGQELDREKLHAGKSRFDVLSVRGQLANRWFDIEGVRLTSGKRAILGAAQYEVETGLFNFPGTLAIYKSSDPASQSTEAPQKEIPFLLKGSLKAPRLSLRQVKDAAVPAAEDVLVPGVPAAINPSETEAAPDTQQLDASGSVSKGGDPLPAGVTIPLILTAPNSNLSIMGDVVRP